MAGIPKRLLVVGVMTCGLVGGPLAGRASASHVGCGAVLTQSTTLDSDVGPCDGTAIVLGADGITLNLGGHRVLGDGDGDAPGILAEDRHGVVVTKGVVSRFGSGVAIVGGSGNTVSKVEALDNVGDGGDFGDGILVDTSTDNVLSKNVARGNGPYSGITLLGRSARNTIDKNLVEHNKILSSPTGPQQDDGIRLENFANSNIITKNDVYDNGLDGIALFADTFDNVVEKNDVRRNGAHDQPHRQGDGIAVFNRSTGNRIEKNSVFDNGANGIFLRGPIVIGTRTIPGATNNQILNNSTGNNGPIPGPGGPRYDLRDNNPSCDANRWFANTYLTAFPECTTLGGHGPSAGPAAPASRAAAAMAAQGQSPEVGSTSSR